MTATVKRFENYEFTKGEYYKTKYFVEYDCPYDPCDSHTVTGENYKPELE